MITVDSESFLAVVSVAALGGLAAGAMSEFGPILLITLLFSTKRAASEVAILVAFVAIAVAAAVIAVRGVGHGWPLLERTLETSGQLAIRIAVVTILALATLAASLGLDLLARLVTAGILSTMIDPLVALRQRAHRPVEAAS